MLDFMLRRILRLPLTNVASCGHALAAATDAVHLAEVANRAGLHALSLDAHAFDGVKLQAHRAEQVSGTCLAYVRFDHANGHTNVTYCNGRPGHNGPHHTDGCTWSGGCNEPA